MKIATGISDSLRRLFYRWFCSRCGKFSLLCRRGSHLCLRCVLVGEEKGKKKGNTTR